ncbi:hypothetical protein AMJ57_00615 [Parcubacteria bacterium SG8_24]|nr:MAG: hypothetical protein AMJ57_00615 [Parcubacteria bacterium SG8_24]
MKTGKLLDRKCDNSRRECPHGRGGSCDCCHENAGADLGLCIHGLADDVVCLSCLSKGCVGGGECSCDTASSEETRRRVALFCRSFS